MNEMHVRDKSGSRRRFRRRLAIAAGTAGLVLASTLVTINAYAEDGAGDTFSLNATSDQYSGGASGDGGGFANSNGSASGDGGNATGFATGGAFTVDPVNGVDLALLLAKVPYRPLPVDTNRRVVLGAIANTYVDQARVPQFPPNDYRTEDLSATKNGPSVYVFVRPDGASGFGHVGFGFRATNSGKWLFGSVENSKGFPFLSAGDPNDFWWKSGNEEQMIQEMKSRGYTNSLIGAMYGPVPNAAAAADYAAGAGSRGYSVVGNNCADNVFNVLSLYGITDLPSLSQYPAPNDWFQALLTLSNGNTNWKYGGL